MFLNRFIHILLLAYVVAALVFWGLSLNRQSEQLFQLQAIQLHEHIDSLKQPALFQAEYKKLLDKRKARRTQYIGEGSTFLVVILIGAGVVYAAFRRRLGLSRQQNNFMLSVTHELKTPLAAIKLNLQTLARPNLTDAQKNQLLTRSISEADRLNELCNNMLMASQVEGQQYRITQEPTDFSELVMRKTHEFSQRFPGMVAAHVAPDIQVQGDAWLLSMVLSNLIENALKYAPGQQVEVVLFQEKSRAVLQVKDLGSGIPEAERRKIFRKFYRIGHEATRRSKGTGLGLYLVQHIVRRHKGSVSIRSNQPQGSIFEVKLPVL